MDLFAVSDLHEKKSIPTVLQNVYCLARIFQSEMDYKGPTLGPVIKKTTSTQIVTRPRPMSVNLDVKQKPVLPPTNYKSSAPELNLPVEVHERLKNRSPTDVVSSAKPSLTNPAAKHISFSIQTSTATSVSGNSAPKTNNVAFVNSKITNILPKSAFSDKSKQLTASNSIAELIQAVADKLHLSVEVVNSDFEELKKNRIETLDHLKFLMKHKHLWKQLQLPLIEKCIIEELLQQPET